MVLLDFRWIGAASRVVGRTEKCQCGRHYEAMKEKRAHTEAASPFLEAEAVAPGAAGCYAVLDAAQFEQPSKPPPS
jgi:hypothetical protein